ncbi:hypothetical protein WME89_38070 [Sorangium sp. So ce321]
MAPDATEIGSSVTITFTVLPSCAAARIMVAIRSTPLIWEMAFTAAALVLRCTWSPVHATPRPPAITLVDAVKTSHASFTACVRMSPPVVWEGALPGGSIVIELPFTSTGAPATRRRSTVSVALREYAIYKYGAGTGPAGGVGGDMLTAGTGPGQK